jgi:hypothetical protein
VYYGLKGEIKSGTSGAYLWAGTQAVTPGVFPDSGPVPSYYRIQQPCLLLGISAALSTAPGTTNTTTVLVRHTPFGGSIADTVFAVEFGPTDLAKNFYDGSLNLNTGDKIHVQLSYSGASTNTSSDLTVQVDMF